MPTQINFPSGQVPAWSISTLQKYMECPLRIYYEKIEKIQSEQGEAAKRGENIHKQIEDYLNGLTERPDCLYRMADQFDKLFEDCQAAAKRGADVSHEGEWAFRADWTRTEWFSEDVWARFKMDSTIIEGNKATVIDYKTGKRYPVQHTLQMIYYAIALLLSNPDLEEVTTELWYVDKKTENLVRKKYTRGQAMVFYSQMMENALKMTSEQIFHPNPSKFTCRFCPFKTGPCTVGVI